MSHELAWNRPLQAKWMVVQRPWGTPGKYLLRCSEIPCFSSSLFPLLLCLIAPHSDTSWETREGCTHEPTAESSRKRELIPGEGSVSGKHWLRVTGCAGSGIHS